MSYVGPDLPRKRNRANGEGGLHQRKNGTWEATWTEHTPLGRKKRSVYGRTAEIAEAKMRRERGQVLPADLDEAGGDVVYFVQSAMGGPIKIGITSDLEARMKVLQMCCPFVLRVLHAVRGVDRSFESALHKRFAHYRLHGEWFENTRELMELIEWLKREGRKRKPDVRKLGA